MYMHIANKLNLTFLDSLNFLPMKLAKIPDAFGIEELSKGFFPHFFNKKENQRYVGPFPDLEYYGYNFMSSGERERNWVNGMQVKVPKYLSFRKRC